LALVKAIIEVLDREAVDTSPGQAGQTSPGLPATIQVQFNPTEYTLSKGAQIAEIAIPGIDSPILQFIRGQNEKLTLDLFFDTTIPEKSGPYERDVRKKTDLIYRLVKIQPKTHAAPRVRFVWGSGLNFKAIVESVQQKFTLFDPDGIPLRATLSVAFREYKTLEDQLRELNLQSSDQTKQHVVGRGDTLNSIAAKEYGDPGEWRRIADANPNLVSNPRRPEPGTVLEIPPADVFGSPAVKR